MSALVAFWINSVSATTENRSVEMIVAVSSVFFSTGNP